MPDNETQPETVVLAPELLADYRDQLNAMRHQLGAILGGEHPSAVLLRQAADKLGEPGILPQRGRERTSGYSPSVIGQSKQG